MTRHLRRLSMIVSLLAALALIACAAASRMETVQLETLNDSGVSGTVTLIEVGPRQTRVEVRVATGGNPDMPAHIHPGSCAALVPQPKYPLQNVVDGSSTTVVPASIAELVAGDLAVNVHRANDDLGTYTACADLG